jgi:Mg2+-importing ATPase
MTVPPGAASKGPVDVAPAATTAAATDRAAVQNAASRPIEQVLADLGTSSDGLADAEAQSRLASWGPNAIRRRRAGTGRVLANQFKNPILILLFATAAVSAFVGEGTDAVIIAVILLVSVGLGFVNEYRAARAADALHDRLRHTVVVLRDGERRQVDVTTLVPGDVVALAVGTVVPADLRLIEATELSCDESIVTGEAEPAAKSSAALTTEGAGIGDLTCAALMGTVVQTGSDLGVVVATGSRTEFGRIASGLSEDAPQTEFQHGLARFSAFLLVVAAVLMTVIVIGSLILHRPFLDSLLFALAIAVGITPQLLPAVVSTSLAAGSRALAAKRVLVKRMVCIEDLGDLDLLVTDKTGTLTAGRISFVSAIPADAGTTPDDVLVHGLLAVEQDPAAVADSVVGLNPLDAALCHVAASTMTPVRDYRRLDLVPFDHERRMTATLVQRGDAEPLLVLKGAPESVLPRCAPVPDAAQTALQDLYAAGARVIAVAVRPLPGAARIDEGDERDLRLLGFLEFTDPPKSDAAESLQRLAALGIEVKIATGDSAAVAEHVCETLGMATTGTLTGDQLDGMDDAAFEAAVRRASIFARVSPEQKSRIVTALRQKGRAVAFLGDGVNDALALHRADIGISVDSAVDVAKDAADVILMDKDLGVLADGVVEGRRIFANTIKYVLMGTSSNFGNMFSASIASVVLSFLPMLPSQILLNNLLYDASQLAIPTDRVDPEQLRAPAHWDIGAIRRFMLLFGPISSLFDFATFGLMLYVFHAAPPEFRSGWFIESIATQTLIIFVIRTTRVPFLRSRPSMPLTIAALATVAVGALLPYTPIAPALGFVPLPAPFFLALVAMIIVYLVLVELAKAWYYRSLAGAPRRPARRRAYAHRFARRAARFTPRGRRSPPAQVQSA